MKEFNFDDFKERNPEIFAGKSSEEIEQLRRVGEHFGMFMAALFDMNNKNSANKNQPWKENCEKD